MTWLRILSAPARKMLVTAPAIAGAGTDAIEMRELASPADQPGRGFGGAMRSAAGSQAARRSDRSLIRAAQRGSTEALELLFRRHWPRAHRAAYLIVHDGAAAEDIAQEAFLAAVRALDRFDRRRPFAPWLNRIVVNRAIDWSRARSLRRETRTERLPEQPAPSGSRATGSPYSEELVSALAALSAEQRAVVVLRYLLEYTPGEIARLLDLPRGTINSRLRRGLDELETRLRELES